MVCITKTHIRGSGGIIDTSIAPFTVNKYGNERHARSLDPNHLLESYRYTGPFTEVLKREQLHDDTALNSLDQASKEHDYAYLKEQQEYNKDHTKTKHFNNIWKAGDKFVKQANAQNDDPIVGNIASTFISTKKNLEQNSVINSKLFSGMGCNENTDPTAKLKELINEKYQKNLKKHKKVFKGGLVLSVAIGTAAAGAFAGKITIELYDFINKN